MIISGNLNLTLDGRGHYASMFVTIDIKGFEDRLSLLRKILMTVLNNVYEHLLNTYTEPYADKAAVRMIFDLLAAEHVTVTCVKVRCGRYV